MRDRYGLTHANVRGLDHDLAYRGMKSGSIDVMDMYSTDAEIAYYGLRSLRDDLSHFPIYNALYIYRADLEKRHPTAVKAIHRLDGQISEAQMIAMNARVKLAKVADSLVAAAFLLSVLSVAREIVEETWFDRSKVNTRAHLWLVLISLAGAIVVAIPLGVAAAKFARLGHVILGVVGIVQTLSLIHI